MACWFQSGRAPDRSLPAPQFKMDDHHMQKRTSARRVAAARPLKAQSEQFSYVPQMFADATVDLRRNSVNSVQDQMQAEIDAALQVFVTGALLMPRWVAWTSDGECFDVQEWWSTESDKVATFARLNELFRVRNVNRYTFVSAMEFSSDWKVRAPTKGSHVNSICVIGVDEHGARIGIGCFEENATMVSRVCGPFHCTGRITQLLSA